MRKVVRLAAGVLFTLFGLYVIAVGTGQWARQLDQRDWEVRLATVTEVTQRQERRGGVRLHSRTVTVYDYTYEYYVYGEYYYGHAQGSVQPREEGDLIDVKFDPEHPEDATHILSVQWDGLALNLGGGVVFCGLGLWFFGLFPTGDKHKSETDPKK